MRKSLLFLIFIFLFSVSYAESAEVIKIIDGDTVDVLWEGETNRVRLFGIDAPEDDQDFGDEATVLLSELTLGQPVELEVMEIDFYGRTVALLTLSNGTIVNREMIRQGYAWVYPVYCDQDFCDEWETLEKTAKDSNIGLWRGWTPIPPWEYRRGIENPMDRWISWVIIFSLAIVLLFILRWLRYRKYVKEKRKKHQ